MLISPKLEIVIDETITRIKVESDFVRLYAKIEIESDSEKKEFVEKIVGTVPIYQVESVLVLGSHHNIPARLVKLAAKHRIPIHFCSSLEKYYGSLEFITDKKIFIKKNQYTSCLNFRTSLIMAKQIVFQKILEKQKISKNQSKWTTKNNNFLCFYGQNDLEIKNFCYKLQTESKKIAPSKDA